MKTNKPRKNYAVIVMRADGGIVKSVQAKAPKLEELQKHCGGPIQQVGYFTRYGDYHRGQCWANEEGKLLGMAPNRRATQEWAAQYRFSQLLVGDVVFYATTEEDVT